jgi:hypothetical protein
MLFNLSVVSKEGLLVLSYYFADASIALQDEWEECLARSTKELIPHAAGGDVCCVCDDRPVVIRGVADVAFILGGTVDAQECECACGVKSTPLTRTIY